MKKIILLTLVSLLVLSTSSFAVCRQESVNVMHRNDNPNTNNPEDYSYIMHIEYSNGESKDECSLDFNPPTPKEEEYTFYENFSGDNIWVVVKVDAEEAFYLEQLNLSFKCNVSFDFYGIHFFAYNSDTGYKRIFCVFPFVDIALSGIGLYVTQHKPCSAGTWYFVFLAANKNNCEFNLTLTTSKPYIYSVTRGYGSTYCNGTYLDKSINIEQKHTLVGWFGHSTPSTWFLSLAYNRYSYTTPSGEKTTTRFFEYNNLFRNINIEKPDGFDFQTNNTLFLSESGEWKFQGITLLRAMCVSHIVLFYADVVLPV